MIQFSKSFSKLPPAHYLTFDITNSIFEIKEYWTLNDYQML